MNKPGILLLWLLITAPAFGGDRSEFELIGFSGNGRFAAFERFGVTDGGGFPYCEIFIVDVAANDYVVAPIKILDQGNEFGEDISDLETVRSRVSNLAASSLSDYGIVKGNRGIDVLARGTGSAPTVPFQYDEKSYTLELKQIETEQECWPAGLARFFELSLTGPSQSVMLQKDSAVPKSRECPYTYSIVGIWCYKTSIAVFIQYETPGFEGPDTRQIIVTGNFP